MRQILFSESFSGITVERMEQRGAFRMDGHHLHSAWELYYLVQGARSYFIEDQIYPVIAPCAVLIRPDVIHMTTAGTDEPAQRILLNIPAAFFQDAADALGTPATLGLGSRKAMVLADHQGELGAVLARLEGELAADRPYRRERATLCLWDLVICLMRLDAAAQPQATPVGNRRHDKVYAILRYLSLHFAEPITLEELAAEFYLEKTYLCHLFREVTGLTVWKYLHLYRIRHASRLLADTDRSVTDIAQQCGYGSIAHFERVFKAHTGDTPRQSRAKSRSMASVR